MSAKKLPWLRLYTEIVDDEKVRLLAFEDRWHYVALLCCKRMGILDAGDPIGLLMRKLSVKLGLALRELESMLLRLEEVGLVDSETAQPTGWEARQFISDSSTERVRKFRARMAEERGKKVGNVTVTAQETDTDKDKDLGAKAPVRPTVTRERKKVAYSDDFELAWKAYPARGGGNNKAEAFKAWNARLKQGYTAEAMQAGIDAYRVHLVATGKVGTEYVKMAATFLGPNLHFLDSYALPVEQAPAKSAARNAIEQLVFGGRDGLDAARVEAGDRAPVRTLPAAHAGA